MPRQSPCVLAIKSWKQNFWSNEQEFDMYKIVHKQVIAQGIKKIDISAPLIASQALPGQFVMVTPVSGVHNIPMTIIDSDERRGVVSLLVHEVGPATRKLGDLSIGEVLYQMVGPLGRGAQMDKYGL